MTNFQVTRSAEPRSRCANENDDIALAFEPLGCDVSFVIDDPDHSDRGSRIDHACRALIIEGDVAAHDRRLKLTAGLGDSFDAFTELPKVLGLVGITEVQIIRHRERTRAGTG